MTSEDIDVNYTENYVRLETPGGHDDVIPSVLIHDYNKVIQGLVLGGPRAPPPLGVKIVKKGLLCLNSCKAHVAGLGFAARVTRHKGSHTNTCTA